MIAKGRAAIRKENKDDIKKCELVVGKREKRCANSNIPTLKNKQTRSLATKPLGDDVKNPSASDNK
jgi:hypothetical protein